MNGQNSHAICDLGLAITKRLVQKDVDLQGLSSSVSLPPILYKAHEKEDNIVVFYFLVILFSFFWYAKFPLQLGKCFPNSC